MRKPTQKDWRLSDRVKKLQQPRNNLSSSRLKKLSVSAKKQLKKLNAKKQRKKLSVSAKKQSKKLSAKKQ